MAPARYGSSASTTPGASPARPSIWGGHTFVNGRAGSRGYQTAPAPPAWFADAACQEHQELPWTGRPRSRELAAMQVVCAGCLVNAERRGWADGQPDLVGTWAGQLRGRMSYISEGLAPDWCDGCGRRVPKLIAGLCVRCYHRRRRAGRRA